MTRTTFPTLYKLTSTKAVQFWQIHVEGDTLVTTYGQLGTTSPQVTRDKILSGKNAGRSNETTTTEQAEAEAQAKHEKQLKKGYVDSLDGARSGKTDALIEGGILPMLAHTFDKQGHKIKYPCKVQPKLDGIRCIAILKNGTCTLWSRSRKPITSCPHIIQEIENNFSQDIVLDGELYNSDFKDNFEHIVHLVRQEEPGEDHTDVEFHVYDAVDSDTFKNRSEKLANLFKDHIVDHLVLVDTQDVNSEDEIPALFSVAIEDGYEGLMLRNSDGLYVNKRSSDLVKVKEMQDAEFEIVSIEEGRGKLSGHVGAFVCLTDDGQEFKAKMAGSTERLKEFFENHDLWKGKQLTVQFQDLTSYGIPRFPVGMYIRDYE